MARRILFLLLSFLLGTIAGGTLIKSHFKGKLEPYSHKNDTTIIYKAISANKPTFKDLQFLFFEKTNFAFFSDTLTIYKPYVLHDTIYVPISQKYYEELDGRLRLWISGYNQTLDKWELDEKETYIEAKSYENYLSLGMDYDFYSCPLYLMYEKRKRSCSFYGKLGYEFLFQNPYASVGVKWTPIKW